MSAESVIPSRMGMRTSKRMATESAFTAGAPCIVIASKNGNMHDLPGPRG